jgi:hypothetical protein
MSNVKKFSSLSFRTHQVALSLQERLLLLGFKISLDDLQAKVFGSSTVSALRAFQERSGLMPSGEVDEATAQALIAAVQALAPDVVEGRVSDGGRVGLPQVCVVALDKELGGDRELGRGVTDEHGRYQITYVYRPDQAPVVPLDCAKERPDLQVVVQVNGKTAAKSSVRYRASTHESIDIVVDGKQLTPRSEFERLLGALTACLSPNLKGKAAEWLAGLREDEERQEITMLAHRTGWDARAVAMLAAAHRIGKAARLQPALLYALFRAGVEADIDRVFAQTTSFVKEVWEQAIRLNVIPAELCKCVDQGLERFAVEGPGRVLTSPHHPGLSPLGELLAVSLEKDAQRLRFAELLQHHRGDGEALWTQVRLEFGAATTDRLQLDARLANLTLNNAPLMRRLHDKVSPGSTLDLVRLGFDRPEEWKALLTTDMPIPSRGDATASAEDVTRYANHLASHLRLAHPTAVVAERVLRNHIRLSDDEGVRGSVHAFLSEHQDRFDFGRQSIATFVRQEGLQIHEGTLHHLGRLQRVYQITPSDEAMDTLLVHGLDSAHDVLQLDEKTFTAQFEQTLGHTTARLTYAKARQVHNAVVNIATSYMLERVNPTVYALDGERSSLDAFDRDTHTIHYSLESDSPARATLEGLFDEMTYCACEHCRSWLSPAAYLVSLLQFLDRPGAEPTPLDVLLSRRPDLQHLQLSCENTNTVVPYVDLVNEILEHHVVHGALVGFEGHDSHSDAKPAELLANPEFIQDEAYQRLASAHYPMGLPFERPLALLRRYLRHVDIELSDAMETVHLGEELDGAHGWRGILIERLGLSPREHAMLTGEVALHALLGEEHLDLGQYAKAKTLARRLGMTYEELIELLRTRFINPGAVLLPRLERLGVDVRTITAYLAGSLSSADARRFEERVAELDGPTYGGAVIDWLRATSENIAGLIVLVDDPPGSAGACEFERLQLRHADGSTIETEELSRIVRFVRLWRKLGWSLAETDLAITALWPAGAELDGGFETVIQRLGWLKTIMLRLDLAPGRDLQRLLVLWAPIDARGPGSLYAQMFLDGTRLEREPTFEADAWGRILEPSSALGAHFESIRGAFRLTDRQLQDVLERTGMNAGTPMTLEALSLIFRHGHLARLLSISVRELHVLGDLTGLDPFGALEGTPGDARPDTLKLIDAALLLRQSPLTAAQVSYLLRHEDLGANASPSNEQVRTFARELRAELERIDAELDVVVDPTGSITQVRVAAVWGAAVAEKFFAFLQGTRRYTVAHAHSDPSLGSPIESIVGEVLLYDDFRKELSYAGVMSESTRDALVGAAGGDAEFVAAVHRLFHLAQEDIDSFFEDYPALREPYREFATSSGGNDVRFSRLLAALTEELRPRLHRERIVGRLASGLTVESWLARTVMASPEVLHADGRPGLAAVQDLLDLKRGGVTVTFTTPSGAATEEAAAVDFGPEGALPLPSNGAPIEIHAEGYLEASTGGFYRFAVLGDAASVQLEVDGVSISMRHDGGQWRNDEAVELSISSLHHVALTVSGATTRLTLHWEPEGRSREVIGSRHWYPPEVVSRFSRTYVRVLKIVALVERLQLSKRELAHFASHSDYATGGSGWLNALPTSHTAVVAAATWNGLSDLFRYWTAKRELGAADDEVVDWLENPEGAAVATVTRFRWARTDLEEVLAHFGWTLPLLKHLSNFLRVHGILQLARELGVSGAFLLQRVTRNDPTPETVSMLQGSLRARYDDETWLSVVRPIHDDLRRQQRDALVSHVLETLGRNTRPGDPPPPTTSDELFERLLIDVQMDPCMQTTRILQANATVQHFVQRCHMGLEDQVSPSILPTDQWAWMKRYRLWEAHRKVFLYPENWLDPKMLPDRSPGFVALQAELLESDIDEDAASRAFVHYLEHLDEVARLDVRGMCVENRGSHEVVHVVARSPGTKRQYWYRRRERSFWTPWEKIGVSIEDDPVVPVVWNGRLFLFWIGVTYGGQPSSSAADRGKKIGDLTLGGVSNEPNLEVGVTLHWTEYFEGVWHPPRSSDATRPLALERHASARSRPFDRYALTLRSELEDGGPLDIWLEHPDAMLTRFKLFDAHGVRIEHLDRDGRALQHEAYVMRLAERRTRKFGSYVSAFSGRFWPEGLSPSYVDQAILRKASGFEVVVPTHSTENPHMAPFFFQDQRHVFFVAPAHAPRVVVSEPELDYGYGTVRPLDPAILTPGLAVDRNDTEPVPALQVQETGGVTVFLANGDGFEFNERLFVSTGSFSLA